MWQVHVGDEESREGKCNGRLEPEWFDEVLEVCVGGMEFWRCRDAHCGGLRGIGCCVLRSIS